MARAEATLAEAKARYENLLTGKRQEEQEVVRAQRREVEAALALAEIEYKRQTELLAKRVAHPQGPRAGRVPGAPARPAPPRLPPRRGSASSPPARRDRGGQGLVEQTEANLAQASKRLDDLMPAAPEDALVENTFFNVGEWVPAGTPVVSLLPPFRVKLRFFVPEEEVARREIGQAGGLHLRWLPGGPQGHHHLCLAARRIHAAGDLLAERAGKLVFLIEARPERARRAVARPAGRRRAFRGVRPAMPRDRRPRSRQALRHAHRRRYVSLAIEQGRICGFLGPNGSGKTTTCA